MMGKGVLSLRHHGTETAFVKRLARVDGRCRPAATLNCCKGEAAVPLKENRVNPEAARAVVLGRLTRCSSSCCHSGTLQVPAAVGAGSQTLSPRVRRLQRRFPVGGNSFGCGVKLVGACSTKPARIDQGGPANNRQVQLDSQFIAARRSSRCADCCACRAARYHDHYRAAS